MSDILKPLTHGRKWFSFLDADRMYLVISSKDMWGEPVGLHLHKSDVEQLAVLLGDRLKEMVE